LLFFFSAPTCAMLFGSVISPQSSLASRASIKPPSHTMILLETPNALLAYILFLTSLFALIDPSASNIYCDFHFFCTPFFLHRSKFGVSGPLYQPPARFSRSRTSQRLSEATRGVVYPEVVTIGLLTLCQPFFCFPGFEWPNDL